MQGIIKHKKSKYQNRWYCSAIHWHL